jgi:hypothetical protein
VCQQMQCVSIDSAGEGARARWGAGPSSSYFTPGPPTEKSENVKRTYFPGSGKITHVHCI